MFSLTLGRVIGGNFKFRTVYVETGTSWSDFKTAQSVTAGEAGAVYYASSDPTRSTNPSTGADSPGAGPYTFYPGAGSGPSLSAGGVLLLNPPTSPVATSIGSTATRAPMLTEAGVGIGGTNDGNIPDLSAIAISIVDNTGGVADTTEPATLAAITLPDLSAWDGLTVFPTAAQATAIAAAFTAVKNALATLAAINNQLRAENAGFRAGIRESAVKVNEVNEIVGS